MESMKAVVISACVMSLVIGMIQAVVPSGKYERQIRLFTACLMLIGILSPLLDGIRKISPDWDQTVLESYTENLEGASEQQVLALAQEEVAAVLQKELASQAIPCSRLSVEMHIDETDCISISSVTVVSTVPEKAEAAIRRYFGKDVEIYADDHS